MGYHDRHSGLIPPEKIAGIKVVIIGVGGIGSPAALALAKMGVQQLDVWDFDSVEEPNIGTQLYGPRGVGRPKVQALKLILRDLAPWCDVTMHATRVTGEERLDADVGVLALDSLPARRQCYPALTRCKLIVDPRMGAEALTVRCFSPETGERWWLKTLDRNPLEAPCTAKATGYTGMIAGGFVAGAVANWVRGQVIPEFHMDLRYLTTHTVREEK